METKEGVTISLYQNVYRLSGCLDPENWIDSLAASQTFTKQLDAYTPVEIESLDAAWVGENGIEAIAVKGQIIARIQYLDGEHSVLNLTDVLDALATHWENYE